MSPTRIPAAYATHLFRCIACAHSFLIRALIQYIEGSLNLSVGAGAALAVGLGLISLFRGIIRTQLSYYAATLGARAAATISRMAMIHVLELPLEEVGRLTSGRLIAVIQNDVDKVRDSFGGQFGVDTIHTVWAAPVEMLVIVAQIVFLVGPLGLITFAMVLALQLLNVWQVRRIVKLTKKGFSARDQRTSKTVELLQSVRIVKLFAWEGRLMDAVLAARRAESRMLRLIAAWKAVGVVQLRAPNLTVMCTLMVYSALGHQLTPSLVFPLVYLIMSFRAPMTQFPACLQAVSASLVSLRRIQSALTAVTIDAARAAAAKGEAKSSTSDADSNTWRGGGAHERELAAAESNDVAVHITSGAFKWPSALAATAQKDHEKDGHAPAELGVTLSGIDLCVRQGELLTITGPVGCGKTSLLYAILGEIPSSVHTRTVLRGRVTYCEQEPWIQVSCAGPPFPCAHAPLSAAPNLHAHTWHAPRHASL